MILFSCKNMRKKENQIDRKWRNTVIHGLPFGQSRHFAADIRNVLGTFYDFKLTILYAEFRLVSAMFQTVNIQSSRLTTCFTLCFTYIVILYRLRISCYV